MTDKMNQAAMEIGATEHEMKSAIAKFEAELWRFDTARLNAATEAAHAALQAHLDAKASHLALLKRAHGI